MLTNMGIDGNFGSNAEQREIDKWKNKALESDANYNIILTEKLALMARIQQLEEALREAPHDIDCESLTCTQVIGPDAGKPALCDCWFKQDLTAPPPTVSGVVALATFTYKNQKFMPQGVEEIIAGLSPAEIEFLKGAQACGQTEAGQ